LGWSARGEVCSIQACSFAGFHVVILIWLLTSEVVRKVGDAILQKSMTQGMDLVNLISNQCYELAMLGKMGVDKAQELMATMIHVFRADFY
jgi:hypothetical protein